MRAGRGQMALSALDPPRGIAFGDCVFEAIPPETCTSEPGEPSMVEFAYLVDLGVPLSVGHSRHDGAIGVAHPSVPVDIPAVSEEE